MASEHHSYDWPQPLCLVDTDRSGALQVNKTTLDKMSQITLPVVVVGIVGLYRTGKSYLMNRLAQQQTGFELGSTVQSKTKGIWIWCRQHPTKADCCLILMDTEGLGDVEKGSKEHDMWIFSLTVLLSSTLVYNSKGTIDQDALDALYFVTELADHIKIRSASDDDEASQFDAFFPTFVWAVRDFTLELEIDGHPTTSDGYLEHVLKLKKGAGKKISEYNMPRECIRSYFRSRKCFTFPLPVNNLRDVRDLDNLTSDQLDPEFIAVADEFCDAIYRLTAPKSYRGLSVTGRMLGRMVEHYVDAIRDGAVPCIETAVEATAKLENAAAVQDSVKLYCKQMQTSIQLPTNTVEELSACHHECEKQAVACFLNRALMDKEQKFQQQLMVQLQHEYEKICQENETASRSRCEQLLRGLYNDISRKLQSGHYARPGGHAEYREEMNRLQQRYLAEPNKGVMAEERLRDFISQKAAEEQSVLAADTRLSEEEKKVEEERCRAEAYRREKEAAEAEERQARQQQEDQKRSYEENLRQLQAKRDAEAKAMLAEQKQLMTSKIREQEQLLQEGFREKAEQMRDEIAELKRQQEEAVNSGGGFAGFFGEVLGTALTLCAPAIGRAVITGISALANLGASGSDSTGRSGRAPRSNTARK